MPSAAQNWEVMLTVLGYNKKLKRDICAFIPNTRFLMNVCTKRDLVECNQYPPFLCEREVDREGVEFAMGQTWQTQYR